MTEETKEQPKGLFDKFMDLYAPLAKQDASLSPEDYAQDYREKQNYVLKQLGLVSPTSGVTTPENTRPVEDILLRNGSQDQPTMDTVEQYVNNRVNYNPELGPVPVKDPNDPDEYRRNQLLEMMEINQMFDGLLQASDLPPISVDQRSAYTSHLLSKPYDAREKLSKKLVSGDPEALEGLDDINAFYAGFDPEAAQAESTGSIALDDEGDGRSLLQRGLEMIFSPAAAAELTPEQRAQLEAVSSFLPQTDIPPLPEAELGSPVSLSILNSYTEALGAEPPRRPEFLKYPSFVRKDKNFDLGTKSFKAYPTAFTQTALNEDDTPKGLRFEPHIDNVNIFTLGGGVTNLKNIKWTGEDKYGFEKDKFYNKNQIRSKIEANSGSKAEILKGLDASKAVETTSDLGREQFKDNKSFAYAVYLSYEDRLTDKLKTYDLDASKLNENVLGALTDYFWNMEGSAKTKNSSGVRIAKAYIDGDEDWYKKAWEGTSAMLDNIIAGGTPMLGIAKRRAIHYNMMGPPEGKGITKITLDGYNLNYIAEDGSTLYTRTDKNKNKITSKQTTLDVVAKQIQAARVDDTPSLSPGEDKLNTDLSPVTEQVDPNTVTNEAQTRLAKRTAYYRSLNDQAKE